MRPLLACLLGALAAACSAEVPIGATREGEAGAAGAGAPGVAETGEFLMLPVSEAQQGCSEEADCTSIETDCGMCCQHAPIAVDHVDAYHAAYNELCADYSGGVCDCEPAEASLRCVEAQCQLIPLESTCDDGHDNDFDGFVDCRDPDCEGSPSCVGAWELPVSEAQQGCSEDADCTLVDTDCGSCCQYAPIAVDHVDAYLAEYQARCEGYPSVCMCLTEEPIPRCVETQCELIPQESS